jgi:hypothetical protein
MYLTSSLAIEAVITKHKLPTRVVLVQSRMVKCINGIHKSNPEFPCSQQCSARMQPHASSPPNALAKTHSHPTMQKKGNKGI